MKNETMKNVILILNMMLNIDVEYHVRTIGKQEN